MEKTAPLVFGIVEKFEFVESRVIWSEEFRDFCVSLIEWIEIEDVKADKKTELVQLLLLQIQ